MHLHFVLFLPPHILYLLKLLTPRGKVEILPLTFYSIIPLPLLPPPPPPPLLIMAGGAKKPVNIFRLGNLGEPKEVFNWKLWFAVISFGLMGAARGVDEGLISGAFNSKDFQRYINYESYGEVEQTNIKANVSAMVQIGSVGGALL